jgi:hypothetical protein
VLHFSILFRGIAIAEPLQISAQPVQIQLNSVDSSSPDVLVHFPPSSKTTYFTLSNPARVVVDVEGPHAEKVKALNKKLGGPLLEAVRVGSHPNRIRLVFDLHSEEKVEFLPGEKGTLRILFGAKKTIPQQKVIAQPTSPGVPATIATTEADATVAPEATSSPLPSPPVPIEQKNKEERAPILEPTPTATPTASPTPAVAVATATATATAKPTVAARKTKQVFLGSGSLLVTAVTFDYNQTDRGPVIRIKTSGRSEYKLSKRDERAFSLVLPNARLSTQSLTLPQFPPQEFVGITFVLPKANDSQVEISIGVERGIRVTAFAVDDEIWVKSVNR